MYDSVNIDFVNHIRVHIDVLTVSLFIISLETKRTTKRLQQSLSLEEEKNSRQRFKPEVHTKCLMLLIYTIVC